MTVPVGSVAQVDVPLVSLPASTVAVYETGVAIWERGHFLPGAAGVQNAAQLPSGAIRVTVGSGVYSFATRVASE